MSDRFHDELVAAITSGEAAGLEPWLTTPAALRRMAVYRNNVVHGMIEVLRAAYPVVERLVGAGFFAPMAKAYWQAVPPTDPVMSHYGEAFADFIDGYAPSAGLVYLGDVARLDRAWLEAHHASDEPALDAGQLAGLAPEALPQLAPRLHPSVHLCTSNWPAYAIWRSNRDDAEPARVELRPAPDHALVWRHRGTVRHRALSSADHGFLAALAQGQTLQDAAHAAASVDAGHNAADLFGEALASSILGGSRS
ncbi:HvfC/BufC family peptide modification chaperone [Maricaulis salignorans]|uniref:Putative DNA-binding domain-containing protein n=1 Tax=Maricaulis salignorans TaxID=144026 RepID=A0A1G9LJF4_9PROT|nr:putative DNA-binding domain-containing protein [Maricaulis salignorans]SDL62020.1 hypothetical protein SAMN04488568_10179 [Maricaulis salignorans]